MDELIQPLYTKPDKSSWFSLNDGWSRKYRVPGRLRRPGARHNFECDEYYNYIYTPNTVAVEDSRLDRYLASKFPDTNYHTRENLMREFARLPYCQLRLLRRATSLTEDYAYVRPIYRRAGSSKYPSELWWYFRRAAECVVHDWDQYEEMRMDFIRRWFHCADTQMPTLEQQRQFEKEAWYWDREHPRALAARRRLARVVVGRLLRMAVKHRALALYWQEQTQRALCAPGGAGRAADTVAFESEFA